MTVLLTDDEAVAIAALCSSEFPARLPTVARVPGEMIGAGLRGARSLMVRGLAEGVGEELVVAEEATVLIEPFIGSGWTWSCFFYSSVSSFPVAAGGVRVFATNADDEWHLDEVSAFGVHSIRVSTRSEFETHARAFQDMGGDLYPANGGHENLSKAVSAFSEGLADEVVVKTSDGFYLAGTAGRDDLPLVVTGSDFAFRRIDASAVADHVIVSA